ncbi:MAG: CotH kinase family protein [Fibrobacterota bacterium]
MVGMILLSVLFLFSGCTFLAPEEHTYWNDTGVRMIHLQVSDNTYNELFSTVLVNEWSFGRIAYSENRSDLTPFSEEDDIYVRRQGNTARHVPKPSFTIKTDRGRYALSAQYDDLSFMREMLSHYFFRTAGFETHYVEPVVVVLNSTYLGVYLIREQIRDEFFQYRDQPIFSRYRVEFGGRFSHQAGDTRQSFSKKYPSRCEVYDDINALIRRIDKGIEDTAAAGRYLDLNNAIGYYAVSQLINNSDGITNNFNLVSRAKDGVFEFVPWDLDRTFYSPSKEGFPSFSNGLFEQFEEVDFLSAAVKKRREEIFSEHDALIALDSIYEMVYRACATDPFYRERGIDLATQRERLRGYIRAIGRIAAQSD